MLVKTIGPRTVHSYAALTQRRAMTTPYLSKTKQ